MWPQGSSTTSVRRCNEVALLSETAAAVSRGQRPTCTGRGVARTTGRLSDSRRPVHLLRLTRGTIGRRLPSNARSVHISITYVNVVGTESRLNTANTNCVTKRTSGHGGCSG